MFDNLSVFRMAQGLARHAAARQEAVAQNVANVNTPGYRQVDIPAFGEIVGARALANTGDGVDLRSTRPGHIHYDESALPKARVVADARQAPNGNSVSLETEIMKAAELRRDHDMALSIYRSAMTLLRAGIGRR